MLLNLIFLGFKRNKIRINHFHNQNFIKHKIDFQKTFTAFKNCK